MPDIYPLSLHDALPISIFSQAVNHAQVGPPSSADQWYIPPEVGKAEHSSAMLRVTSRVPAVASGQPSVISSGPPMVKPYPNRVTAPVRMEMMENEIAKLENPPMLRNSSCA